MTALTLCNPIENYQKMCADATNEETIDKEFKRVVLEKLCTSSCTLQELNQYLESFEIFMSNDEVYKRLNELKDDIPIFKYVSDCFKIFGIFSKSQLSKLHFASVYDIIVYSCVSELKRDLSYNLLNGPSLSYGPVIVEVSFIYTLSYLNVITLSPTL